ncbi:1161_t:CDS:2 [Dentiscutata heterogama]|uniref:1161_t:CDS:1 n=1 Tax=Dentiscutata heterogama TaxID=1316150 RepID=A0ACA9KJQ2_9GLOM|nr:1161_t:CDS:2 [Dentiscutata heterogama]
MYGTKVSTQEVFLWEERNNQTLVAPFGEFLPDRVYQNSRILKKKKTQDEYGNIEEIFRRNPQETSTMSFANIDNVKLHDKFAI